MQSGQVGGLLGINTKMIELKIRKENEENRNIPNDYSGYAIQLDA